MLYTELTKAALRICLEAHKGQVDKTGVPYLLHPFHVANHVEGELETCVALLHDVVEDSAFTLDDLRKRGMPEQVVQAVALLSHEKGVAYERYIAAVKQNPLARAVKLADLAHNMDLGRLDQVTPEDRERVRKYARARDVLLSEDA